jgi:hypothetical protein
MVKVLETELELFVALSWKEYVPLAFAGGCMKTDPFPPPSSTNVTHDGWPDANSPGAGDPDANTANVDATPAVTEYVRLPVKTGGPGDAGALVGFGLDTENCSDSLSPAFVLTAVAVNSSACEG